MKQLTEKGIEVTPEGPHDVSVQVFRWDNKTNRYRPQDEPVRGEFFLCHDPQHKHKFCYAEHVKREKLGVRVMSMRNQQPFQIEVIPGSGELMPTQVNIFCKPIKEISWQRKKKMTPEMKEAVNVLYSALTQEERQDLTVEEIAKEMKEPFKASDDDIPF